jgi:hypothetical protein
VTRSKVGRSGLGFYRAASERGGEPWDPRTYRWCGHTKRWIGPGALVALCAALPATGMQLGQDVQAHGFVTQTLLTTSANRLCGDSDGRASLGCTEVGLNGSWLATPRLQLAVQGLLRRAGADHHGDLQLDYGLLDYAFVSDLSTEGRLRLGRYKLPLGFYNETRDVAFTRPSILLPQSIYFDRTRNLALSADGASLHLEARPRWGELLLDLGAGWPRADKDTEMAVLARDWPGTMESGPSVIGRLLYERDGGLARLAVSVAQVNLHYSPHTTFPSDLDAGSLRFTPLILSAQYNGELWSLTAEYAQRRLRYQGFGAYVPDQAVTGESWYLQAAYRLHPHWEALVRYDSLVTDRSDPYGRAFQARTGIPGYNRFAKDWAFGLRWDISQSLMARAELHLIDGAAWLPVQDNPNAFDNHRHWSLFAVLVSFRF